MKNKIIIRNIRKNYGKLKVLDNISFNVNEGEFISIIGPSGCGKTTLLYLIQRFIHQSSGRIEAYGRKGFVFQDHNLFPWKTIEENIKIGPINQGKSKKVVDSITNSILKEIGLFSFKGYYPHQISEGMKQRVGIARCLVNNSEIILMDEPFGSLDYLTKLKMQDFLLRLWKKRKLTIVFVTHDIDEAITLSSKIIILSKLPARVREIIQVNKLEQNSIIKKRILRLIDS